MVVQLLVCEIVARQPAQLKAIENFIVDVTIELTYPPFVLIYSRKSIIEQTEVRVHLGRNPLRVIRIVICERSFRRQIAINCKLRKPIVIHSRNSRLATLLDSSVHRCPNRKLLSDLRINIHLHVRPIETAVIPDGSFLLEIADGEIIVDFVGTSLCIHADVGLRRSLPYEVVPIERTVAIFLAFQPFCIIFF